MRLSDLPVPLLVLWLLWVGQSAWACFNVWNFRKRSLRLQRRLDRRVARLGPYTPRAVVIVPVKNPGEHFADHVKALHGQGYPDYRLVFVVESAEDPAHAALTNLRPDLKREMELVVAGRAETGGQKVHNQLAALRTLRDSDEAVVFADADAVPHDRWLGQLVESLRRGSVGVATGYRWFVPDEGGGGPLGASSFASIINGSIATLLGPPRRNHAWGGSMAMTRTMLDECKLAEHWRGALSDDYQLTRAVKLAGKRIVFVPRCLVVSPVRFTWASLWEFGRRQYTITRVHEPLIWLAGLLITGLYTSGWVSVAGAAAARAPGWAWGFGAWGAVAVFDVLRTSLRRRAVRDLLGKEVVDRLAPAWRLERWATPLWMGLHFLLVLTTAFGRRITWARIAYDMAARQDVRIVERPGGRA